MIVCGSAWGDERGSEMGEREVFVWVNNAGATPHPSQFDTAFNTGQVYPKLRILGELPGSI